jgi:hypothetical protein
MEPNNIFNRNKLTIPPKRILDDLNSFLWGYSEKLKKQITRNEKYFCGVSRGIPLQRQGWGVG